MVGDFRRKTTLAFYFPDQLSPTGRTMLSRICPQECFVCFGFPRENIFINKYVYVCTSKRGHTLLCSTAWVGERNSSRIPLFLGVVVIEVHAPALARRPNRRKRVPETLAHTNECPRIVVL